MGMPFFSYSIFTALIFEGYSRILKILSAAEVAFPMSGPMPAADPAYAAPNMIANEATITSSASAFSTLSIMTPIR